MAYGFRGPTERTLRENKLKSDKEKLLRSAKLARSVLLRIGSTYSSIVTPEAYLALDAAIKKAEGI